MHRLHRDSHIAARARFRPLNETHYQLRKTNPIFFIRSSSLRKARTRADEIRSPFLFLFLFLFSLFFFLSPLACPSARMSKPRTIRVSSTFCRRVRLHSSSSAPLPLLDTFLAIHKRQAPHAPTILSRFRDS